VEADRLSSRRLNVPQRGRGSGRSDFGLAIVGGIEYGERVELNHDPRLQSSH
jgi:hypothetical protein